MTKPILTTIHAPQIPFWHERAQMLDRNTLSRSGLVRRIVAMAPHHRAIVLKGSVALRHGYSDLIAAGVVGRQSRVPIVLDDCEWEVGSAALQRLTARLLPGRATTGKDIGFAGLARTAIRAIDSPRTVYCVLSTEGLQMFPRTWDVDPARVAFVPWHVSASADEIWAPVSHDGPVFAGGDSMRDYGPMVEAARRLPDVRFTIASQQLVGAPTDTLPPNVTTGWVAHERFIELLQTASVVIVPLAESEVRSAGQQTYLNAMAMGKTVIVTEAPGVRDHLDAGLSALVVPPGDPEALARTIGWALDPVNREAVDAIRCRARQARERFTYDNHLRRLAEIAEAHM